MVNLMSGAVTGPGHHQPTVLTTNRTALPARQVIQGLRPPG